MWMVKSNEHGQESKMSTTNPVYVPRLRPPTPMAISSWSTKSSTFSTTNTSNYSTLRNPNIPAWNQPLAFPGGVISDYGVTKEINRTPLLVSARWNPTPDQLQALEEMYKRGIRTPSPPQIQQITAKLRRFGKIEGKNVFYWFQNHKARDKQKKRRQLELLANKKMSPETKQSGLTSRYNLEILEPNKLANTSSNCSTSSKYSINGASVLVQECKNDVWTQMDQKELQHKIITSNSQIYSSLDNRSSTHHVALGQENAYPFGASNLTRLLPLKYDGLRNMEINGIEENKTLQLFPIRDNNLSNIVEETKDVASMGTSKFTPRQFFEFLPMKNE